VEQGRAASLPKLPPQIRNVHVDDIAHWIEVQIPDLLKKYCASDNLLRVEKKEFEQLEFLWSQIKQLAPPGRGMLQAIQLQVSINQSFVTP